MEFINSLIDNYNIPVLTAFLLGILTSISPCPLATNLTAVAFISREIKTAKNTFLNGIYYTLGRTISYTLLVVLIYFGFSSFSISNIFAGWGDKLLGPILIGIALIMLDLVKLNFTGKFERLEKLKAWLASRGHIGSLFLGMVFALAFCPYSGVLFFGILIPLLLTSQKALLLAPIFALGTGLPVIIFSSLLAFGIEKISKFFNTIQIVEKYLRYIIGVIFIIAGLYYLQFLIKYLVSLYN